MASQSWVGFAGGRDLPQSWAPYISKLVARAHAAGHRIVTGCAGGADEMVVRACLAQKVPVVVMAAGNSCPYHQALAVAPGCRVIHFAGGGPRVPVVQRLRGRTLRMVKGLAKVPGSVLVALPGGVGTALAVWSARAAGVRVAGPGASPVESAGGDPPTDQGVWFDDFDSDPQAFRPDRYLIGQAKVMPNGQAPLGYRSTRLCTGSGMPRKKRVRKPRLISRQPHLIFTCSCGHVKRLHVQGDCQCYICAERHSVMPVIFQDELYLKARALYDRPLDTDRSLADDTQGMGWPEEAGSSNDPLDRALLSFNERAGFHIVNHDLWGEWSGHDSQID